MFISESEECAGVNLLTHRGICSQVLDEKLNESHHFIEVESLLEVFFLLLTFHWLQSMNVRVQDHVKKIAPKYVFT